MRYDLWRLPEILCVYKLTMEFDYVSTYTFKVEDEWEIDGNDVRIIRNTSRLQC